MDVNVSLDSEQLKVVSRCTSPTYVHNKYTGKVIRVGCGHCAYCINQKARKASMRVSTAGSAFKYCYFVTLTYDNAHIPLMSVSHIRSSDFDYADGDIRHQEDEPFERFESIASVKPLYSNFGIELQQGYYFKQVRGTLQYNRDTKEYYPAFARHYFYPRDILSLIGKTASSTPYKVDGYSENELIPFLNYVDVQNYIKRLRINLQRLGCNEKISFYAVGEYGPVHFRPHFHILLFGNTSQFTQVCGQAHAKSWKFGRSDFQLAVGGASSYVASYVNSLASCPSLYRTCKVFRPKSRASNGFYEKAESDSLVQDSEDGDHVRQKFDLVFNGKFYQFGAAYVKSTPPLSYIRCLLPRFSSVGTDDCYAHTNVVRAVLSSQQRIARVGIVDFDTDCVYSWVSSYWRYLLLLSCHSFDSSDKIILHQCRLLSRGDRLDSISLFDEDYAIGCLYRLFLSVSKFLRLWHLPLDATYSQILKIFRVGFEMESCHNYELLRDSYIIQSVSPNLPFEAFYDWSEMTGVPDKIDWLDKYIDAVYSNRNRDMIKHKRLNDANELFNKM